MNIKQSMKLSAIIGKMDLKITNPKASQEEIGADLIIQAVGRLHKAEKEIISFVADYKKITAKEAEEVDIIAFIKEMKEMSGLGSFLTSAAK